MQCTHEALKNFISGKVYNAEPNKVNIEELLNKMKTIASSDEIEKVKTKVHNILKSSIICNNQIGVLQIDLSKCIKETISVETISKTLINTRPLIYIQLGK